MSKKVNDLTPEELEARREKDRRRKALKKITELLAKAESTDSPAEAEALAEKASELMAKYGIKEHQLNIGKPKESVSAPDHRREWVPTMPFGRDRIAFLCWLGNSMRVSVIRDSSPITREVEINSKTRKQEGYWVDIIGYPADVDRLMLMWASLCVQSQTALAAVPVPHYENDKWGHKKGKFSRDWITGWFVRVASRIEAIEKKTTDEAVTESTGLDLVLADAHSRVEAMVAELFPKLKMRSPRNLSTDAFSRGYAEGARADIGRNIES